MEEKSLPERLDQWYNHLREQEKEKAIELKDEIEPLMKETSDPALKNTYDLLLIRFYLLLNDLDRAGESLEKLEPFEEQTDSRLNYFYYYFHGIFLLEKKRYRDSINNFLKAQPYLCRMGDRLELAEFIYKLAAAYHRANYITLSIDKASEALKLFKDEYHYKRSADCENLLGVNNKFISQYEEAEVHYHNAIIYTEKFKDNQIKNMVYHNLGNLYLHQNLFEAAINYLLKANQLMKPNEYERWAKNLYLLSKAYFKENQTEEACKWLEKGLNFCLEQNNEEYIHHLRMLQAKYISEGFNFEKTYREGIAYFERQRMWEYVIEYGEELGTYYKENGLYQEACSYFYQAIEARNQTEREVALV